MFNALPIGLPFKVMSLLKALCFLLETDLLLSGADMSLYMFPGLISLADVEFTNSEDSESGSSVASYTSFFLDKADS